MRTYGPIFESQAVPFVRDFRPDLLIVSAGYDTLTEDSLAQVRTGGGRRGGREGLVSWTPAPLLYYFHHRASK